MSANGVLVACRHISSGRRSPRLSARNCSIQLETRRIGDHDNNRVKIAKCRLGECATSKKKCMKRMIPRTTHLVPFLATSTKAYVGSDESLQMKSVLLGFVSSNLLSQPSTLNMGTESRIE